MQGTFRPGDRLEVESTSLDDLAVGDVILFHSNISDNAIVHRIVESTSYGLVTRGDSNKSIDLNLVTAENILGRVMYYERTGQKRRVWNGQMGIYWAKWLHLREWLFCFFKMLGRGCYSLMRKNQIAHWFWRPTITQITLTLSGKILIKYLHNGRTVAHWWPSRHYFECRKPYDLVIPNPENVKKID
jgi:hypothetical protein